MGLKHLKLMFARKNLGARHKILQNKHYEL